MIPHVFISSTIEDLGHLREAVGQTIDQLGYKPVMSEHGDVAYLSTNSAIGACQQQVKQCHVAIVIVGKRYGSTTPDGTSITELEYATATESDVPVYTLVDRVVLAYKDVYDASPDGKKPNCPGMDEPAKTFQFLRRITGASRNNAILAYSDAGDAVRLVKQQIAQLFGALLEGQFGEVNAGLKDVLSEIKALRRELLAPGAKEPDRRFLKGIRFLLGDRADELRELVAALGAEIDEAVPVACDAATFDEFVSGLKATVVVDEDVTGKGEIFEKHPYVIFVHTPVVRIKELRNGQQRPRYVQISAKWCVTKERQVVMDTEAKAFFDKLYNQLRHQVLWPPPSGGSAGGVGGS